MQAAPVLALEAGGHPLLPGQDAPHGRPTRTSANGTSLLCRSAACRSAIAAPGPGRSRWCVSCTRPDGSPSRPRRDVCPSAPLRPARPPRSGRTATRPMARSFSARCSEKQIRCASAPSSNSSLYRRMPCPDLASMRCTSAASSKRRCRSRLTAGRFRLRAPRQQLVGDALRLGSRFRGEVVVHKFALLVQEGLDSLAERGPIGFGRRETAAEVQQGETRGSEGAKIRRGNGGNKART